MVFIDCRQRKCYNTRYKLENKVGLIEKLVLGEFI